MGGLVYSNKDTTGSAIIDRGTSTEFIELDFAIKNTLHLTLKLKPEALIAANKREAENRLTHTCTVNLTVDQHLETLTFQVTNLPAWNIILEKAWLKKYNPGIDWIKNMVTFGSSYCQAHCLPTWVPHPTNTPVTTYWITIILRAAFHLATE